MRFLNGVVNWLGVLSASIWIPVYILVKAKDDDEIWGLFVRGEKLFWK